MSICIHTRKIFFIKVLAITLENAQMRIFYLMKNGMIG